VRIGICVDGTGRVMGNCVIVCELLYNRGLTQVDPLQDVSENVRNFRGPILNLKIITSAPRLLLIVKKK
jgi:hypothetical protein